MARLPGPEALDKIMKARGLKQTDVETAVGVTQGTVSRWLSRQRTPGREPAIRMQKLYGIPVDAWGEAVPRAAS